MERNYKTLLRDIDTFVFDVDGVLTNGMVQITTNGDLLRQMSVKDGFALKTAVDKGYRICIITGGVNKGVEKRLKSLGITDIYMGAHHKIDVLKEYLKVYGIDPKNTAYMGDDLPDVPPMAIVGLASCPQNAVPEVKAVSHYVSHKNGGDGCARDLIEQVLKVRGDWKDHY